VQSSPGADFVLQLLTSVRPAMLAHSAGGDGGGEGDGAAQGSTTQ
jgi:hypothetical protein